MDIGLFPLLLLLGSAACLDPQQEEQIGTFIEEYIACSGIPGLSVGVVKNGVSELASGFGVMDLENGTPVTGSTLFNIASTSKAFTTVLLAQQLLESSEYDWDTPVKDILGDWFNFYSGSASNNTMLRDIVSHKTGIPRHDMVWFMNPMTRNEIIERLRFVKPVFPVRTTFQYTNNMYTLAGVVSEHLAEGTSWEDLIRQRIFEPLGMTSSTFTSEELPVLDGHATPYEKWEETLVQMPWQLFIGLHSNNPAGGISSNAEDMNKWMNYLLGHGPPGMSHRAVEDTLVPELAIRAGPYFVKPEDPEFLSGRLHYARGWFHGNYRGYRSWSHGGDLRGFHSYVFIVPDLGLGIFHTFNLQTTSKQREMVSAYILDVVFGATPWFTAQDVCDAGIPKDVDTDSDYYELAHSNFANPLVKHMPKPLRSVDANDDYISVYGNFFYSNITITTTDIEGETYLNLLYGEGDYLLSPATQEDSFMTMPNNEHSAHNYLGQVNFGRNGAQEVESLIVMFLELLDPPTFYRDLQLADAPPSDINTC